MKMAKVIFALGNPGAGKGTGSAYASRKYGIAHLSAGDLLRREILRGVGRSAMIAKIIKEGKIVPVEITVELLLTEIKAVQRQQSIDWFIIDGFPRNMENFEGWSKYASETTETNFVLYFSCTEEESLKRMLQRGIDSGRSDDNHESALKRLETYQKESVPIITMYQKLGIVHRIDTNRRKEETFAEIDDLFAKKGFLSEN